MRGLIVFRVGAVVANLRIGQNHDLPGVGRVSENFLVAGNGGIKNYFPVTFAFCSVALTAEDSAIFQRKYCLHRFSGGVDFMNFSRHTGIRDRARLWIIGMKSNLA